MIVRVWAIWKKQLDLMQTDQHLMVDLKWRSIKRLYEESNIKYMRTNEAIAHLTKTNNILHATRTFTSWTSCIERQPTHHIENIQISNRELQESPGSTNLVGPFRRSRLWTHEHIVIQITQRANCDVHDAVYVKSIEQVTRWGAFEIYLH